MGFERNLNPGEQILVDVHTHWKELIRPIVVTFLCGVGFGVGNWALPASWKSKLPLTWVLAVLALAAWLAWGLPPILRWITSEHLLTTDRLVVRRGIFSKTTFDIPLERVNAIVVHQSFLDRIMGSGDLLVESAAEQSRQQFENIPRVTRFQQMIQQAIEANREQTAARGLPPD